MILKEYLILNASLKMFYPELLLPSDLLKKNFSKMALTIWIWTSFKIGNEFSCYIWFMNWWKFSFTLKVVERTFSIFKRNSFEWKKWWYIHIPTFTSEIRIKVWKKTLATKVGPYNTNDRFLPFYKLGTIYNSIFYIETDHFLSPKKE